MSSWKTALRPRKIGQETTTRVKTSFPNEANATDVCHDGLSENSPGSIGTPHTSHKISEIPQQHTEDKNIESTSDTPPTTRSGDVTLNSRGEQQTTSRDQAPIDHKRASVRLTQIDPQGQSSVSQYTLSASNPQVWTSNGVNGGLWSWIPHVSQSADDSTVKDRVNELFVFAEQFVDNFYVDRTYQGDILDDVLERVNGSQFLTTPKLQEYLIGAHYHTSLIKHVLVSLLLDLISFNSTANKGSLLPKEFQNYNVLASAISNPKAPDTETPHIQPALSAYRVLSGYLRSDVENDDNYLLQQQITIRDIIAKFERAFRHWINRDRTRGDRQNAFSQVLRRAGKLGIFLFCQPSVFDFEWRSESQHRFANAIPICPHLLRVYDNEAQLREKLDHLIPMRYGPIFDDEHGKVNSSRTSTNSRSDRSYSVQIPNSTMAPTAGNPKLAYDENVEFTVEPLNLAKRLPSNNDRNHRGRAPLIDDTIPADGQELWNTTTDPQQFDTRNASSSRTNLEDGLYTSLAATSTPVALRAGIKNRDQRTWSTPTVQYSHESRSNVQDRELSFHEQTTTPIYHDTEELSYQDHGSLRKRRQEFQNYQRTGN